MKNSKVVQVKQRTARPTILIDPRKKAVFERLCAQEDLTPSQVVRRMIRAHIETHLGRPWTPGEGGPVTGGGPMGRGVTKRRTSRTRAPPHVAHARRPRSLPRQCTVSCLPEKMLTNADLEKWVDTMTRFAVARLLSARTSKPLHAARMINGRASSASGAGVIIPISHSRSAPCAN